MHPYDEGGSSMEDGLLSEDAERLGRTGNADHDPEPQDWDDREQQQGRDAQQALIGRHRCN